jgi:methionyl-tRNA formyltransferase
MKIVFMGTPDFAVPSLKILHESQHSVIAVVTGIDKEKGRGQKLSFTPVKEYAVLNNLPVIQPEKLKDPDFIKQLNEIEPDLIVVVAFRILPVEVFSIPKFGSFNLHGSLLPKYRGAAPIQWALMNGDNKTGVTSFKLEQKVDTGNVYLKKEIDIEPDDDMGSMHDKLSLLGAECVLETVNLIESGEFTLQRQDDSEATPAPKITKEMGLINWNEPADKIYNLIRAFSPAPGAYFFYNDKQIKIYRTEVIPQNHTPGTIIDNRTELIIGCGKDSLKVLELQQEGKKRMTASEFLRGFSFSRPVDF